MAQELVLIPKTKYDHLLEQIEGRKIEEREKKKKKKKNRCRRF